MLQGEHSAILSTFIKLTFVIKIFVLSIFERPLKTGFTVFKVTFSYYKWHLAPEVLDGFQQSLYGYGKEQQIQP